jgi:hypothetical protein
MPFAVMIQPKNAGFGIPNRAGGFELIYFQSMRECILHFGLPKTASTSIQQFLRHDLEDAGFCYPRFSLDGGNVSDDCHNRALCCAFFSKPEEFHTSVKLGLSVESLRLQGADSRRQLTNAVQRSTAHTLILSAESLYRFPFEDLQGLVEFLSNLDLRVRAIGYVRQFKRQQESLFQQRVREPNPGGLVKKFQLGMVSLCYQKNISKFDELLGNSNVIIREFDPRKFEAGCPVRHFCQTVGIQQKHIFLRAANESLSLEALQLLYTFRMFGAGYGKGGEAMIANTRLLERLSRCGGTRFFYHSSLLAQTENEWRPDVEWAEERTGIPLLGNIHEDDEKPGVRCEADLLRFSKESLEWLAWESGVSVRSLLGGNPETVAQAVERLREPVVPIPGRPGFWKKITSRVGRRIF